MKTRTISLVILTLPLILLSNCCPGAKPISPRPHKLTLIIDTLFFVEDSQTFTLHVYADSIDGANSVTYYLQDGDSILMNNEEGTFSNVPPSLEGYDIRIKAEWSDTTMEQTFHQMGFRLPRPILSPLSKEELEQRINAKDRTLINDPHLEQSVKIITTESHSSVDYLIEVIDKLENEQWESVVINKVTYNNDIISEIFLKPIGKENPEPIGKDDTDEIDEEDEIDETEMDKYYY